MAATTPATVLLKGADHVMFVEHPAGGTITPGMLIALGSGGTVAVHAVAGGSAPERMFALEDDLQGKGITDTYASTNTVRAAICPPGTEIYALCAAAQSIAIGDKLESAGTGYLREHIPQGVNITSPGTAARVQQVVAIALEALDSTSPVGASRLKVRVV
jgi:hypothetical protein